MMAEEEPPRSARNDDTTNTRTNSSSNNTNNSTSLTLNTTLPANNNDTCLMANTNSSNLDNTTTSCDGHWSPGRGISHSTVPEGYGRFGNKNGRYGQWTCFLCCHVRTGTVVIGFWHMLLHLMALSLIAVVVVHPDMLSGNQHVRGQLSLDSMDVQRVNCTEMPCLLATKGNGHHNDAMPPDFPITLRNLFATYRLSSEDVNVALFITLCTFVVTLLLVYGAFKGQPSHLMPFFFLQVFDFCISSMTMIGYLSYLPNVRQLLRETPTFPFQRELLAMNTKCLTFFVMLIFVTTFMVKAYCISIVWRCYKFLMMRAQNSRWILRQIGGPTTPVDQESQTLVLGQDLPDYNTAIADPQYRKKMTGLFPEPPPSYDMAMAALFAHPHAHPLITRTIADDAINPAVPTVATSVPLQQQQQLNLTADNLSDPTMTATTTTTIISSTSPHDGVNNGGFNSTHSDSITNTPSII